ncbi:MAG: DUF2334 domain-containing protein [Clostridiales bacterium]|nr:DUF2334 domain-containing protein [Clostridiales bacterium]
MNKKKLLKIFTVVFLLAVIAAVCVYLIYSYSEIKAGLKTINDDYTSETISLNRQQGEENLFTLKDAPTEIYFLDEPLNVETYFYSGRLYVPFEETYDKIVSPMGENSEEYGVKLDNFIFSGYSGEKINPYFMEIDGRCFISFYKIVKGIGLAAVFDGENDKAYIYYRKTDTSDLPELVKSEDSKPAVLRLEDITPDGYCQSPRYTDEGLEKLRAVGEYLERREQTFYIAAILRYVNPDEGIDVDLTKMTNTYTADFMYTLDYLIDKGGKIIIHGYTHQFDNYFSADGFEFGHISTLSRQERAERLVMARDNAEMLGFDNSMWEFPHYGASLSDLKMAEEVYSVIFQGAGFLNLNKSKYVKTKTASDGHTVTYVPLPAYYLNNIYELDDMLERIQDCEDKGCVVGLFFHPSIDFEKIEIDTTPWGVRNWYYTPYWALPVMTDKIIGDGYTFTDFEEYLQ